MAPFGKSRRQYDAAQEAELIAAVRSDRLPLTPIGEAPSRERVRIRGVLRTVTLRPRGGVPALVAELGDETGAIWVTWLGRHQIVGIEPGTELTVEGLIGVHDRQRVMFNPRYSLHVA